MIRPRPDAYSIRDAAFSPDGRRVAIVTEPRTDEPITDVRVAWIQWADLIAALRDATSACLTAEQRVLFLGEAGAVADERVDACEDAHGR